MRGEQSKQPYFPHTGQGEASGRWRYCKCELSSPQGRFSQVPNRIVVVRSDTWDVAAKLLANARHVEAGQSSGLVVGGMSLWMLIGR
jgi:hypothetical protein